MEAPPEPKVARPDGRLRVLVVDDNADAAETVEMLLGIWGHEVRVARDGPEALAIAAEYEPDVALLDIGLPGMSGYEVGQRLRAASASLHIVAMTGYGQPDDQRRARESGFSEHLVKPVEPERLQALLAGLSARG